MAAGGSAGGSADAHLALTLLGPGLAAGGRGGPAAASGRRRGGGGTAASSVKTVKSVKSSFLEEPEG